MFKRKRLYDRRDTYHDTGIPCGNPKRVQTGEVLCMPSASAAEGSSSMEQMVENMKTQGEEQLRAMAQKQVKTKLTMQELSSQHRQFTESGQYKPALKEVKGVLKLQEYKDIAKGDDCMEMLRQCGLTTDEIRLQLGREQMEKGQCSVGRNKATYGPHPDIQEDQFRAIDSKIKDKEASLAVPDTFRGLKEISRQEMDIEKSMFRGTSSDRGALTSLLTDKKSDVVRDPNDPINHLPQLMADIEERAREKIKEKRRRRRRNRKLGNKTEVSDYNADNSVNEDDSEEEQGGIIGCLTYEEMQALNQSQKGTTVTSTNSENTEDSLAPSPSTSNKRPTNGQDDSLDGSGSYTNPACASNHERGTISGPSGGDRKVLKGPIEFLPEEYIQDNRLSLDQIKKLPKFANYEAGTPSNVLYLKNLAPRSCERDLVSLFGRFQESESPVVYRLMTGRMRGQAFVTFSNTDVAAQAMHLINGFLLHGKPVIVQYGRRTTA